MFGIILLVLLGVVVLAILWGVSRYNSFVHYKNLVAEAWSGVDVQLKRRYDLIPNLVETVKGYSTHEKGVLENIAKYRSASMNAHNVQEKSDAEKGLTSALKTLFAVVENYPDLKANQNFMSLQNQLSDLENQIQLSRRYYNGVVRDYNTSVTVFPGNIIASMYNFKPEPFFELASSAERENVKVQF